MQLLINLSVLGPQPTGLGVYAAHCAAAATASYPAKVVAPPSYQGAGQIIARSPQNIVLGAGKAAAIRRWLWSNKFDLPRNHLVYCPTHHGFPDGTNQILTIHDLIALRFPEQHPTQHFFFRHLLPRRLKKTKAVFTVSEVTRQDLHDTYKYPLDDIHVVPNGVSTEVFKPAVDDAPRQPFLLIVGAAYPHKNVEELLKFAHLWKDKYRLLIASCRGKYRAHLEQSVAQAGLQQRVEFLAYVSTEELVRLYQTCAAFVYPSKWEGFGIPPLEAMACGAPVIASDIAPHREVLGEHAHLIKLGDEAAWAGALARIAQSEPRPTPGTISPIQRFTWAESARLLVSSLKQVEPKLQLDTAPSLPLHGTHAGLAA